MQFDLIGDVHGHAGELEELLTTLDYRLSGGIWHHRCRTAVFLGDFVDRGPRQHDTLQIVRGMIDNGHALSVMGNHEFNAIAFHLEDSRSPGQHLRRRTARNRHQHEAFLREIEEDSSAHADWVDWFLKLPLWLDLGGLRVVHACWHPPSIRRATELLGGPYLTRDLMPDACQRGAGGQTAFGLDGTPPSCGSDLFHCVETLLKGIEVTLPEGVAFHDTEGNQRTTSRIKWWLPAPRTLREASLTGALDPDALPEVPLPQAVLPGHDGGAPVFIGHYWLRGSPAALAARIASLDYSVARQGSLVAYRWSGEDSIRQENFVSARR